MIRTKDIAMTKLNDDDIAGLLPFYVAGTLDDADAQEVARWLKTDPRGSEALNRVLEEQAEVVTANERIDVPSGALATLMQDVANEPQKSSLRRAAPGLFKGISDWLNQMPSAVSWAAAAALALVVVVQNVPMLMHGGEPSYEVSSGAQDVKGRLFLVRFADTAGMAAVNAALSEAAAVIADGPKGNGNYIVRLAEGETYGPVKERIETLRAKRDIVKMIIERSPGN